MHTENFEFSERNEILLLWSRSHCYVVANDFKNQKKYIADGTNQFVDDKNTNEEIRQILEVDLIGLRFEQQDNYSHCGTSAACIILVMKQAFRFDYWPKILQVSKEIRSRMKNELHQHPDVYIKTSKLPSWNVCDKCNMYKRKQASLVAKHKRFCKGWTSNQKLLIWYTNWI